MQGRDAHMVPRREICASMWFMIFSRGPKCNGSELGGWGRQWCKYHTFTCTKRHGNWVQRQCVLENVCDLSVIFGSSWKIAILVLDRIFISCAKRQNIKYYTAACTNFQTGRWKMLHLEKISSHSCKRICLISIMGLGRKLSNWNWKNWKITNLREWTGPALFQVQVRCQMAQRKRIKTFIRN